MSNRLRIKSTPSQQRVKRAETVGIVQAHVGKYHAEVVTPGLEAVLTRYHADNVEPALALVERQLGRARAWMWALSAVVVLEAVGLAVVALW